MSETARTHRLGLYLKSRDRQLSRNIAKKSVITNSRRRRAPTPTRTIMATEIGISWSSTKSYRNWRITEIPKFYIRYARKTEAHRGPEHYFGIIRQSTGSAKWSKLLWTILRICRMLNQFNSGNSHVTSRPVSFPSHPIPEGMLRHSFVSPSRREGPPSSWDTHGFSGNVFADPPASSSAPYPQELHQWNSSIEEPLHSSTVEKSERPQQNQDLRCQSGPSAKDSVIFSGGDSSKNYGADQQRLQILDLHFDKFPTPPTFACWKIRFKTEVCTCSQFPTEAMQWIKEVEMVDSVDELRSSSSFRCISMPNFEVLDARIASALNKIIHNSHFKRRISLEEQKTQKQDRFLRGKHIAYLIYDYLIYDYFQTLESMILLKTMPTYSLSVYEMMIFRNSIRSGTNFIVYDENLTWWYLGRIVQMKNTRGLRNLKTVLEMYDLEIHQKKLGPDYHRLETNGEEKALSKKFEIRILGSELEIMRRTPWSRIREQKSVYKEFLEIVGNGNPTGSV